MRWLLAVVLFAVVASCGSEAGRGEPSITAHQTTPAVTQQTATPSPAPSPAPAQGIEMHQAGERPFPEGMAMIIGTGCWGCDAWGPDQLIRVYRDPTGSVRSEVILDPTALGYGPREVGGVFPSEAPPFINGVAMTENASLMFASVCIKLSCAPRGLDEWFADSVTVVLRSDDGGITWEEIHRGGPALAVIGIAGDQALVANYQQPEGPAEFSLLPSATPLVPPADIGNNYPLAAFGQVFWRTGDGRLLRGDGSEFLHAPDFGFEETYIDRVLGVGTVGDDKGSGVVQWTTHSLGDARTNVAPISLRGGAAGLGPPLYSRRITYAAAYDPKANGLLMSVEFPGGLVGGPVPAFLDLETGEYQVFSDPFRSPGFQPQSARYVVYAGRYGPFARVVDTGACLNVRAAPSLTGEVLDCAADGVLLVHDFETADADGITWLRVSTPGGTIGWAATGFLEY